MNFTKTCFRHCLLYEFNLGHNPAVAYRNLRYVFGEQCPSERTVERWFSKFSSGDFSIEDQPRAGRPVELNIEKLLEIVKENPRLTTREMEIELNSNQHTINNHLSELGFRKKFGVWVPHDLSDEQKFNRVSACSSLLSRSSDKEWIKQIVTGDEKWVMYVNHTRKLQWVHPDLEPLPEPKGDLHPKKVMLSVFWDFQGIIWYELLNYGETITANLYSNQLQKLAEQLQDKRKFRSKVYLLHDNARPHIAKITKKKIKELGWEVLPHAPYSPDLAPSDYHLFRSLSNFLKEKNYDNFDHLKSDIEFFFHSRSPDFYAKGIFELPTRWEQVVDKDGEYIID